MFLTISQWQQLIYSLIGMIGVLFISNKQKFGFVWISVSQALFVFYFCNTEQYFLALQNFFLIGVNVFGYIQWTRKGEKYE